VRREKAVVHSGSNPPGNWFAPTGRNQSSGGGNETVSGFWGQRSRARKSAAACLSSDDYGVNLVLSRGYSVACRMLGRFRI